MFLEFHPSSEKNGKKENSLHDLSFQKKYLLIDDGDGQNWLAESYGMEWIQGEKFQLLTPPRTIKNSQVKNVIGLNEVEAKYHSALQLRKLGKLKICTDSWIKEEHLRKIFITPSFKVEISSGEQVEWSDIKKIFWENTLCFDSLLDYFYYPHVV